MSDHLVVELNNVKKSFKKFTLGPVNLTLEKGFSLGIAGANGSGKSTLFRLLVNILQADEGTIHFFGKFAAASESQHKQNIGFSGELVEAFSHLTIKELASYISYWYPHWDHEKYSYFLRRYLIDEKEKFGKCSKGTKKKVEFIFSLCHNPDLLLLDEPSAGVDISSQKKMKEDLVAFMEGEGKCLVIATHNVAEIESLCDFIAVLHNGSLLYHDNKDSFYENWAWLWVDNVPESILKHPNTLKITHSSPIQILTDNVQAIENELMQESATPSQIQRLSIEELIEYFSENECTKETSE
ncbi:ATP-binding cassette domain-containing protein [Thalassorhabdus alkalitolerans]|uniref:ATP-binding cassette domain-containing protein n=1 Tax=Thalassorhabdus alkalitolerans TaxID=2282697 RepID=A0ABW0YNG5_9BACI